MKCPRQLPFQLLSLVLTLVVIGIPRAFAQSRMSDKDVQTVMKNLHEDAKRFQSTFNSAVKKSTIRNTSQEKDAKALVAQFTKQTQSMLKQFKSNKKADQAVATVSDTADKIDKLLAATPMGEPANNAWAKVKTELGTLSQQFQTKSP